MFSCKFWEIFKETFLTEQLQKTVSVHRTINYFLRIFKKTFNVKSKTKGPILEELVFPLIEFLFTFEVDYPLSTKFIIYQ